MKYKIVAKDGTAFSCNLPNYSRSVKGIREIECLMFDFPSYNVFHAMVITANKQRDPVAFLDEHPNVMSVVVKRDD